MTGRSTLLSKEIVPLSIISIGNISPSKLLVFTCFIDFFYVDILKIYLWSWNEQYCLRASGFSPTSPLWDYFLHFFFLFLLEYCDLWFIWNLFWFQNLFFPLFWNSLNGIETIMNWLFLPLLVHSNFSLYFLYFLL